MDASEVEKNLRAELHEVLNEGLTVSKNASKGVGKVSGRVFAVLSLTQL